MNQQTTIMTGISALALFGALTPAPVRGQSIWHDHTRPQSVWIETHHVEVEGEGSGILTTSSAIGGRYRVTDATALTVELPFAYADADAPFESDFSIGNPYLGVEYSPNDEFSLEGGVRLPLGSDADLGMLTGLSAEFADRTTAYLDDVISVHIVPSLLFSYADGFRIRLRGGPAVWIPTNGGDEELIFDYGGTVGFENAGFGGELGVTGWMVVSEDDLDFGERSLFQLGGQVYRRLGNGGRIGALIRIPLDDELENVDFVLGLVASMGVG